MPRGPLRSAYGETRMLNEYLAFAYPNGNVYTSFRLGPLVPVGDSADYTAEELAMAGVFRRWADAVVVTGDELIVVEAKMRSAPGAVAQLLLYDELVEHTPDLAPYLQLRRALELVVSIDDPAVRRMAEKHGVRVKVYKPDWYAEWANALNARERRAPRDFAGSAGGV